ncbi:MAG TPA: hypothetical protein DDZ40_05265 [Deltaproteobacteria bacterium]|nr:hypothetical protein [Deltaproteobacteria bacterium]
MDILSKEQLSVLMEYRDELCVSLYMPAFRTGPEKRQNQIRFKNLVRKAEEQLNAKRLRSGQVEDFLSSIKPLVSDNQFWSFFQSEGFCAFISGKDLFYFRLPLRFDENVTVSGRFHLKPVLGLVYNDSRFFVLALGLNGARFFQCSRHSMNELVMDKVPKNFDEAMQYNEQQKQLHYHTNAPQSGGRGIAVFHGQGGGIDDKKSNILQYFKLVDHGVSGVIGQEKAPLLFAGLDHLFGIYKKANSYPYLARENLAINPEDRTDAELHERAIGVMGSHFLAARDEAIDSYLNLAGTGRTAGDIETILPEAFGGRVDSLLVSPGAPQWGRFDPASRKVEVHESRSGDDEDLLDLACAYTYLKGGAVYDIAPGSVPGVPSPAAVFRF